MEKYLRLIDDVYLRQQPNSLTMAYISKNYWEEVGVNETAFEILRRLDGKHTLEMLIRDLSKLFNEERDKVEVIICDFIKVLKTKNLLQDDAKSQECSVTIKGSKEYFVPDSMILELTHNCPLRCKHCYANAGVGASMNIDKLVPLLSKLNALGTNHFQLTGGEPFAYPYIEDVIDLLLDKKVKFSISTSGFYWNKRMKKIMDKLEGRKVSIQVSLDGLSKTHNNIRENEASYDNAIRFIKESVNRNILTTVATCMVQQGLEELQELCGYLKELGVQQYRLGMITNLGRADKNHVSSSMSNEEFRNIITKLKEKFETDSFHISPFEEFEDNECKSNNSCGAGYKLYNLTPRLTLTPCTIFKMNIGNLNTELLETVLIRNSQMFSGMNSPSDSICQSCELLAVCKGCFAEGFANKNKPGRCHWYENECQSIFNKF